jgi:hypothetical protein
LYLFVFFLGNFIEFEFVFFFSEILLPLLNMLFIITFFEKIKNYLLLLKENVFEFSWFEKINHLIKAKNINQFSNFQFVFFLKKII